MIERIQLIETLDEVIMKGFPDLADEDIQTDFAKLEDALLEVTNLAEEKFPYRKDGYFIDVDDSMKNAPIQALKGGFAHELGHIISDKKESWIDGLLYKISTKHCTLQERNADLNAIIRGYGKELLVFREYSESTGNGYSKDEGLSRVEIKQIIYNRKKK